jgi:hypothetical protein
MIARILSWLESDLAQNPDRTVGRSGSTAAVQLTADETPWSSAQGVSQQNKKKRTDEH